MKLTKRFRNRTEVRNPSKIPTKRRRRRKRSVNIFERMSGILQQIYAMSCAWYRYHQSTLEKIRWVKSEDTVSRKGIAKKQKWASRWKTFLESGMRGFLLQFLAFSHECVKQTKLYLSQVKFTLMMLS